MNDNRQDLPLTKVSPVSGKREGVRLADFIHENTKPIVHEWEIFAKTRTPAASDMSSLALRDHIQEILAFIVSDMKSSQTSQEQIDKSQGEKEENNTRTAAETHAALRLSSGFDIDQMVSEYRALRASVIKLWGDTNKQISNEDLLDLTRFNESIDQVLAESVSHYTKKVNYSKDLFIGILSHDLRNPLGAISMSAKLMMRVGSLTTNLPCLQNRLLKVLPVLLI
jgi:signal transduction histidine kinase